jgi:hypothetical protein
MRYLVELTKEMSAKNKPQLEIINYLKDEINRTSVSSYNAKACVNDILKQIVAIEAKYPRCKPISIVYDECCPGNKFKDQKLYCPDLFTIHFKGEKL